MRYDVFLGYLINELECSTATKICLSSKALIECLTKHRELISGPNVWSPKVRAYVHFEDESHGQFAVLKPSGPSTVQLLGKLVPVYCRLCFLSECHDHAKAEAQALLVSLTGLRDCGNDVIKFEIRVLTYLIDNLSSAPPCEWGEVCQSPDVSVETKIAVELLWPHLVLVYAGNRKLLLCNLELFFIRPQDSVNLCPRELRAALFVHGKHDPVSLHKERHQKPTAMYRTKCPVIQPGSKRKFNLDTSRSRPPAGNQLHESRLSRLCWLGALWILDIECNKDVLHWLYKPEPCRT